MLGEYGVSARRQTVIANWAPLDEIVPVPRDNEWAIAQGAAERITFLYAGSLGLKHEPLLLVDLAALLPDALVIVVAQGAGADLVAAEVARRGLLNVHVLPSQPYDQLSNVLGSADVLVALLDRQGGEYSVPSKVLSYLCTERAILASIPLGNFAAQTIIESGGGVVVEPGAIDDWLSAARRLAEDEGLRSRLARDGRAYARRMFDIERIADEFDAVISDAVADQARVNAADSVLVTGAGGFIGGHMVARLREMGQVNIRAVDIKPIAEWHQVHEGVDNLSADLSRLEDCRAATQA